MVMCGKVAQRLTFWAVNHDTMGSNLAETVYIFFIFVDMSTHYTNVELCVVVFSNVLLKLQASSHKIVMEHSTFVSTC